MTSLKIKIIVTKATNLMGDSIEERSLFQPLANAKLNVHQKSVEYLKGFIPTFDTCYIAQCNYR